MGETKHTPGPWAAERRNGHHAVVSLDGESVALVHDVMSGDGGFSNAKLVAAAPDLLAALEQLVAWTAEAKLEMNGHVDLGEARDAIDKARGDDNG